ncbi:MAG: acyl-CoA dehydrogenase, partial [Gammaproteobacteria bacterium]
FCARSLGVARLRALRGSGVAYDATLWREMCELGWGAIVVPEAAGGLGLGAQAVAAVCRELGRVVAPEPMLECGVAAAALLAQLDDTGRLLGALGAGELRFGAALAADEEFAGDGVTRLRAVHVNGSYRLDGTLRQVPLGSAPDGWLVPATLDGDSALFHLAADCPGLAVTPQPQADGSINATLVCDELMLGADALLAHGAGVDRALAWARELARVATAAYLQGLAERLFDITLDYLKTRQQFGRPIGSFQALQHRAVDLYIQTVMNAAVVDEAARDFDAADDDATRARAASRAKYRATEAALQVARQAVQLHGGIGYTDECDVGLYLNRALTLAARHGNAGCHARRLAALLRAADDDAGAAARPLPAIPADGEWDSVNDDDFRRIVRDFFEREYPAELRYPSARLRWSEIRDWYMTLSRKGWVAPAWPAAHGGMGLSPAKLLIYIEEQER